MMAIAVDLPRIRAVIEPLMTLPWKIGATGPKAYDCWNLMAHIERELAGRAVPWITDPPENIKDLIPFVLHHPHRKLWHPVKEPAHLALVEMAHNLNPWHVGVYLDVDGGGIIHTQRNAGVCFDTLLTMRAAGFRRFTYHDWQG